MRDFAGKVAVITGAASGIGRGIAERCAKEGMSVVIADVEEKALTQAEEEMKAAGSRVLAVLTDVSKLSDVEALAQKTLDVFGAVHLLFNNAGVGGGATIWESSIADWKWIIGVNLWGVIHGVHVFVPIMLKQDTECHIVNTSSIVGVTAGPDAGIYKVSKHGVVSLSETLYYELAQRDAKINVSVLCPSWVNTRAFDSARNRPAELRNDPAGKDIKPKIEKRVQAIGQTMQKGMSPQEVADCVFNAIREGKLYIITHPGSKDKVRSRMEDILQERNPATAQKKTP
ncbi:MAG: SDR family NAD(P)-dependent oxidoreductase [Dehalococcoidia bacterium]